MSFELGTFIDMLTKTHQNNCCQLLQVREIKSYANRYSKIFGEILWKLSTTKNSWESWKFTSFTSFNDDNMAFLCVSTKDYDFATLIAILNTRHSFARLKVPRALQVGLKVLKLNGEALQTVIPLYILYFTSSCHETHIFAAISALSILYSPQSTMRQKKNCEIKA